MAGVDSIGQHTGWPVRSGPPTGGPRRWHGRRGARPYTDEQKQGVLRRVQGGESQVAIAAKTGFPLATVGYWVRKAKGGAKAGRKPGRPRGRGSARPRAAGSARREEIAWALDGDVIVVRIPLRHFARQLAQKALANI